MYREITLYYFHWELCFLEKFCLLHSIALKHGMGLLPVSATTRYSPRQPICNPFRTEAHYSLLYWSRPVTAGLGPVLKLRFPSTGNLPNIEGSMQDCAAGVCLFSSCSLRLELTHISSPNIWMQWERFIRPSWIWFGRRQLCRFPYFWDDKYSRQEQKANTRASTNYWMSNINVKKNWKLVNIYTQNSQKYIFIIMHLHSKEVIPTICLNLVWLIGMNGLVVNASVWQSFDSDFISYPHTWNPRQI